MCSKIPFISNAIKKATGCGKSSGLLTDFTKFFYGRFTNYFNFILTVFSPFSHAVLSVLFDVGRSPETVAEIGKCSSIKWL